jgi:hypothetical protein
MKEMNLNSTNSQGATMKKALFVVAIAAMLVFSFAASAMATANGGSPAMERLGTTGYGSAYSGYILWSTATKATFDITAQATGPHGDYTINTLKCAVCHSVHGAASGGVALTQVRNNLGDPSSICAYCHGIGTSVTTRIVAVGYLTGSDHTGKCASGCHGESIHGANRSDYKALAARLLNNRADAAITQAITDTAITGVTSAMMNSVADGLPKTMATAYTCAGTGNAGLCHGNSAFGTATNKTAMDVSGTGAGTWKKGHPVFQNATATWSESGAQYGNKTDYPTGVTIAWANADGCNKCHDVKDSTLNKPAFPHNQVGSVVGITGTSVKPHVGLTSKLWMSKASYQGAGDQVAITDPAYQTNYAGIVDGVCLKCHRPSVSAGVGYDF